MIDLRHPLAVLASRMAWQGIEASLAHRFSRQVRSGKKVEYIGLFGPEVKVVGGGRSNGGRPRLPIRLMVSLLYLKHAFIESDEVVVERWAETPTWQYFSGMDYFEHRLPCDATLVGIFRKLIGEEGVEALLSQTIAAALNMTVITRKTLQTVVVDSTVQPKAIAHPTDSRLLEVAREKLVVMAKAAGMTLKQTFAKEGSQLTRKAGGYAHAREFGVKVGIASTLESNLILGPRSFPNTPYDGHTLAEQLEQASILDIPIKDVYVDHGYRGVEHQNPGVSIKHRGKYKSLSEKERRLLKRRQAIEPIIGHLKSDPRMNRCHLKGSDGDAIHAVLCAVGHNIRWLVRMILKKGIRLYLSLIRLLGLGRLFARKAIANPVDRFTAAQIPLSVA